MLTRRQFVASALALTRDQSLMETTLKRPLPGCGPA